MEDSHPHPHTSYIYAVISDYCKPTKQVKPSSVCRKYVGGGENPPYSLIFSEMFLFLYVGVFLLKGCNVIWRMSAPSCNGM